MLEPDASLFAVQPRQLDCVQAMLVHQAHLLQGRNSCGPLLTPSVLLICFDP